MNIEYISKLCSEINRRLEIVNESTKQNNKRLEEQISQVKIEAKTLKEEMREKSQEKLDSELGSLLAKLETIESEFYPDGKIPSSCESDSDKVAAYKQSVSNEDEWSGKLSLAQNELYECISRINSLINDLNGMSFDIFNPPQTVTISQDTLVIKKGYQESNANLESKEITLSEIDSKPDEEILQNIASEILFARIIIADLKDTFTSIMSKNEYDSYIDSFRDGWISEEIAATNLENDGLIHEYLIKETDVINKSTFTHLEDEGRKYDSDLSCGSNEFSEAITIGNLEINVTENTEYHKLISESPLLKQYLEDGKLKVPHIVDLTKNGNIWLNVNEEKYSDDTFRFIHQVILQFLLAFPAGRLNLCLIDVDEVGDFARYTTLKSINSEMLCGGVVRDRRGLADTLQKMGEKGFDIYGEISASNCNDIYQYNEVSRENPKSFHLVVLLNYPSGMREDENVYLKKMMDYNRSGIFTFVVNNQACKIPSHVKPEEHLQTVQSLSENTLIINKTGSCFTVENPFDHIYHPLNGISHENFKEIYDLLHKNENAIRLKPILLEEMFAETERLEKENAVQLSSEMLDIPIGKAGANIQNILFDTTGKGSAHAVIIGGTGSGKSNLLHTIIMNACYKYSPDELNIYLVDFKGGVEFQYYEAEGDIHKQFPHIKLTGLTSDPEDGLAILSNMVGELNWREAHFKDSGVEDIMQYRLKLPDSKMPRILLIIDEIQELFENDDLGSDLGAKAITLLSKLAKKGRAFGINILWASQNIPSGSNLRTSVLSQIGNRISLKLNRPDDASEIDIDPKKVRNLNRPEKGLGLIADVRSGESGSTEFRVAYAYDSVKRRELSEKIIEKWNDRLPPIEEREPLFIVGNSVIPSAKEIDTKYAAWHSCLSTTPCLPQNYTLNLGQNYVTGKPYDLSFGLRDSRMNLCIAGSNIGEIRDIMGYAVLSVIIDNVCSNVPPSGSIYYYNGEYKDPADPRDLYYVLPEVFSNRISEISSANDMVETMRKLYLLRRERAENIQASHSPIFVFIHKMQSLNEILQNPKRIILNEPYAAGVATKNDTAHSSSISQETLLTEELDDIASLFQTSSSTSTCTRDSNESMDFKEIFKELFARGSDVGIHFVLSMDSPENIGGVRPTDLENCMHKIVLKGYSYFSGSITQKAIRSLDKEGIALHAYNSENFKFKPYRYDSKNDEEWLLNLRDELEITALNRQYNTSDGDVKP